MSKDKKQVDFLIVGQGLAGSLLAYELMQGGQRVQIIDKAHEGSSSKVAAGLMNPVTGRRFVKSWMVDTLFPYAKKTYQAIEQQFGVELFRELEIFRALFSMEEQNHWDERIAFDSYSAYMSSAPDTAGLEGIIQPPFSWGGLKKAGQLNVPLFLTTLQQYFIENDCLSQEAFRYEDLSWDKNHVFYDQYVADKIIFCEGQQARFNPWFAYLPFVPSKGEMLEISLPENSLETIVKHKSYLVPLPNGNYWVGSTYEWNDLSEEPSDKGIRQLTTSLDQMLEADFKIEKKHAAIRPTVKDRRPFLGEHPDHPRLLIFNGLGTKGTSLGPFWANQFCLYLLENQNLVEEVNIRRFADSGNQKE